MLPGAQRVSFAALALVATATVTAGPPASAVTTSPVTAAGSVKATPPASTSVATATSAAPLRRTLTSTVFTATVRPSSPTVESARPSAPRPPPPPLGFLLAGMHTEYGVFRSPFLADRMSAVSAQQPQQGALSELVFLFGVGLTGELRFSQFALVPAVTYLFTPRFFNVELETNGSVNATLAFAHAITGSVRGHFYLPVSGWVDLVFAGGPSIFHARFRGRGETALGVEGRFGLQFHNHELPDARLLGTLRYAPLDFGDGVELDLSGLGLVADVVFDLM
ncbi:MAG: hypothetical protein RMA76_08430 [Deltaproteobacteria bacterium]